MEDAGALWAVCAKSLQDSVSEAAWKAWFCDVAPVRVEADQLVLAVPNQLIKQRIEGAFASVVRQALDEAGATELGVEVTVGGNGTVLVADPSDLLGAAPEAPPSAVAVAARPAAPPVDNRLPELSLTPRYSFETFVIGASNRFAHAAALSVAEMPARSYNPLFIYGAAGLGKTHLLHAIAHYVQEHYPTFRVRYVATETMLNEFFDAIRTNTTGEFKRRYRECDLLLIDDIQFIEGKERLQEEFFHTFNHLHSANRQIVISSDRRPDNIPTLEDRLRSRFKWGLLTDVQPPELETRIAILRNKAEHERTRITDDVLEYIGTRITDNIRELEGALIRITAYASLNGEPINVDLAERVLADLIVDERRSITPRVILEATSEAFGFSIEELTGKSRRRPLVTARQVGMYVFRQVTDFSYPAIGREFGGRDHTTVMHAVEKIAALMKERRQIYDQVTDLIYRIKGGG